jgi:hypothetical protein
MLKPGKGSLFRWWFIPLYDKFETNADSTAWRFAGQRAQLLSQEEYANAAGQRFAKPHTAQSANRFAKQFTERFYELSKNVAVFSELQNAFDLTVFAALIKKHNVVERIGWDATSTGRGRCGDAPYGQSAGGRRRVARSALVVGCSRSQSGKK